MKLNWKLIFIIFLHVVLLSRIVFFPYPELFLYPYLLKNGFLPYTQIFDQHFPSVLLTPINLLTFAISTPLQAKTLSISLIVLNQILIFIVAKKITKDKNKALLANLIYLFIQPLFDGGIFWIDSFATPLVLLASYYYLNDEKNKSRNIFLTGLFLGLCLYLKQTFTLPIIGITILLVLKRTNLKRISLFLLGSLIPVFLTFLWVVWLGVVDQFIYWTFIFNFSIYPALASKLPSYKDLAKLALILPAGLATFAISYKRSEIIFFLILLITIIATSLGRFEFVHLQPIVPILSLLVLILLYSKYRFKMLFITLLLFAVVAWSIGFYRHNLGNSIFLFDSQNYTLAQTIDNLTSPNDHIFILGAQPIIYYLANRLPSGRVFSVPLPWNLVVTEDQILAGLKTDPPKVILVDSTAKIDNKLIVDYSPHINKFISENYKLLERINKNEIYVPK